MPALLYHVCDSISQLSRQVELNKRCEVLWLAYFSEVGPSSGSTKFRCHASTINGTCSKTALSHTPTGTTQDRTADDHPRQDARSSAMSTAINTPLQLIPNHFPLVSPSPGQSCTCNRKSTTSSPYTSPTSAPILSNSILLNISNK